ncbi:MAG: hypothetical protein N2596_02405 [Syntrophorhabdaceae bacterium]|nr:hypothetical protein [Syntrophorhabdaceae bacterium]
MLIITHHAGDPHGLLGPQLVATFFSNHFNIHTYVVGVKRGFNERNLLSFLKDHYKNEESVVCFSYHCGRPDLIRFARELKDMGFKTILGGPQAKKDISGEPHMERYPHRFKGFRDIFDLGYSGPIDFFEYTFFKKDGLICKKWTNNINVEVAWDNILIFHDKVEKLQIKEAQILRSIGCPYAIKREIIEIEPPVFLSHLNPIEIEISGCSFCDVSWDKGYCGHIEDEKVLEQITRLPEENGYKIPFELIDEYPIGFLTKLLEGTRKSKIKLTQINLVLRANDILNRFRTLEGILNEMEKDKIKLLLSSIGFESFSRKILKNLNKGVTVEENIETIKILRELKQKFPETLLYKRDEGAVHGFIHPTPWDDENTQSEIYSIIGAYNLFHDILPYNSTPLIIHHGSALGD